MSPERGVCRNPMMVVSSRPLSGDDEPSCLFYLSSKAAPHTQFLLFCNSLSNTNRSSFRSVLLVCAREPPSSSFPTPPPPCAHALSASPPPPDLRCVAWSYSAPVRVHPEEIGHEEAPFPRRGAGNPYYYLSWEGSCVMCYDTAAVAAAVSLVAGQSVRLIIVLCYIRGSD